MNVCEALLKILADHEVEYIFGVPGDAINELIEAIRKQDKIKFIHVMHEEAGAFAASAQAKLTGKLAVCAGTAGPGAIHLLNGLYDAKMDHAPVLAITGQVETSLFGTASHQEVNLQALFQDVSVFNQTIINPEQMPGIAILACQTALSKKGVSHISIPANLSTKRVPYFESKIKGAYHPSRIIPQSEDIQNAVDLIHAAQRPCILIGIGAKHAVPELIEFSERINAPIIKALRGKDLLPDLHPLALGGTGLLGTAPAVKAIKACDLLIILGSDFPYHDFYPGEGVSTIQVDLVPHHIGRRNPVTVALTGDVKSTLEEIKQFIQPKSNDSFLKDCQQHMQKWLKEQDKIELSTETPIHPQTVTRCLGDLSNDDAIICCDTGEVTVWGARNFRIKGTQRFTLSGGLASMAFGLPAAIGTQIMYPGKQVIALCGDGGFAMLMCDFATAVRYKLPIKVFIFNNSKLGLIQMEEEAKSGNPEYETGLHNPDYAMYAEACGGIGYTVKQASELHTTIEQALKSDKASIINIFINPKELTWPPEIEVNQAFNYVKAKIKEYFIKA
jgi:pyruvate oxidase